MQTKDTNKPLQQPFLITILAVATVCLFLLLGYLVIRLYQVNSTPTITEDPGGPTAELRLLENGEPDPEQRGAIYGGFKATTTDSE